MNPNQDSYLCRMSKSANVQSPNYIDKQHLSFTNGSGKRTQDQRGDS
jgi:hypothetical protein